MSSRTTGIRTRDLLLTGQMSGKPLKKLQKLRESVSFNHMEGLRKIGDRDYSGNFQVEYTIWFGLLSNSRNSRNSKGVIILENVIS